ncbi:hypothetical protein BMW22_28685 (plasmid) [Rhizobium leguminosarum]|uniref:Uncharacterized protein n=1 Tax=Rhizobium leguminosarum TaxID=384 RepID=A0A1B1CHE1_RHILE|nr:hypothetical protein BA011_25665 [Rhizobium leguminosarum]API55469.1 hypothetical protein BMW22_28685 [Rhizobium leguminosarum]
MSAPWRVFANALLRMFERGDGIVRQKCGELIAPGERRMVSRASSSSVPRRAILLAEVRRPTFAESARMFQTSS